MSHVQKLTKQASASFSPIEPILLCCLLFMVYEAAQGNTLKAVQHVRLGRRIMEEQYSKSPSGSATLNDEIHTGLAMGGIDTISSSFARLSLDQRKRANASFQATGLSSTSSIHGMPGYHLLDEAGIQLERLIESRHQIQSQLLQLAEASVDKVYPEVTQIDAASRYCLIHTLSRCVNIEHYKDLQHGLIGLMSQHDSWKGNFDLLLSTRSITSQTSTLFQIWYFISRFNLFACRQVRELLSDRFENDCIQALDLISHYLSSRKGHLDASYGPVTDHTDWYFCESHC